MKKLLIALVAVLAFSGAGIWYAYRQSAAPNNSNQPTLVNKVEYLCNSGKTVEASLYRGTPPRVVPGEPPVPVGSVDLVLSDGRQLTLPQTISADGVRYANSDESFVFWSKGNGARVSENNVEKSYIGCLLLTPDPGGLPRVYSNGAAGFSIRYPAGYSADVKYKYQELGPGQDIYGVKFAIPSSEASGTNLSSYDTGVSVEEIPAAKECGANLFLDQAPAAKSVTDGGTEYSLASSTGAGAGNRYEETVWAFPGTNPCIAVRYLIHYGVFENYPPGAVREFDRAALLNEFDKIRRTLVVL